MVFGGKGRLGFPDLRSGQKLWWNWYLTPVVNFGEVQRAQSAKSTLLTSTLVPWDLLRSFQMLKREWGAESNGKLPHLFIPSKTATLVPVFAGKNCLWTELQPWFLRLQWKTCPWAEHSDDDGMDFKVHLHQRSLAPIWNEFDDYDDQWYLGMDGA